jgi:hypothetical protein
MSKLSRRTFAQLGTGAFFAATSGRLQTSAQTPVISNRNGTILVVGDNYAWEYSLSDDTFTISDQNRDQIVSGKMQPSIVVAPGDRPALRICIAGKATAPKIESGKITFEYTGVNGGASVSFDWRFAPQTIWTDPISYDTLDAYDIVSLHYFCEANPSKPVPSLHAPSLVVPGICMSGAVSPILDEIIGLDEDIWLGRGSFTDGLFQQWGLPVHYFCGLSARGAGASPFSKWQAEFGAFTCGLADLPAGDLFLQIARGHAGLRIDYRSDIWKHLRGPGKLKTGATLIWTIGPDYYETIGAYYRQLLGAGIIRTKQNSEHKTAVALTPQYCTWGAECERGKAGRNLNEAFLRNLSTELKASGMKAGLFSIDDKWEGVYGTLEHDPARFPHFEEFLAQLRADGMKIGIWSALMRCANPAVLGLTEDNMLQTPAGKPFVSSEANDKYFIFDFTQPEVERVLETVVRKFIRRYRPDIFKFDFGYELPAMSIAAPRDKKWAGELLMRKGLDIVIHAMREENPDLVVMYYNLSPLFVDYFDLHSLDDLFLNLGDYDVEANRRLFFSSLMGLLGIPTYGSSGYDWATSPAIWFDSAPNGTIGSLNDFAGDERNKRATPEHIARYNGVAQTLRMASTFEILPVGDVPYEAVRGAHARSWARFERGQPVLVAYRPPMEGDEDIFQSSSIDSRLYGVVKADFPVIVSSKTDRGITRSEHLVIVPYRSGDIIIRRQEGRHAEIRNHYFGSEAGGSNPSASVPIEDGKLFFRAEGYNSTGQPLEWIEVIIT